MKVSEYIERVKEHYGWDSEAEQEWQQIQKAIKLQTEVKRRFIEARDVYNEDHISPEHKQRAMDMATTFQGVLDDMGVEYD